jgi:hypothetical protein
VTTPAPLRPAHVKGGIAKTAQVCVLQTDPTAVQNTHVLPVSSWGPNMLFIFVWRTGMQVNAVVPFGVAGQPSAQGGHAAASGLGDSAVLEGHVQRG